MFAPRSSFLIAAIAVLALIAAAEVDADKSARNARQLKGGKGPKSPKSGKGSAPTPPHGVGRRLFNSVEQNRDLTLQHLVGRFNEEGSVRSYVDSLGYEVDLKTGTGEKENVLSKKDCEGLMSLIDHGSYSNIDVPNMYDIQMTIDESDVVSVIGKVSGFWCVLRPRSLHRNSKCQILLAHFPVELHVYYFPTRINSSPCLISTEKLSGLPFLSRQSLFVICAESKITTLSSTTTPTRTTPRMVRTPPSLLPSTTTRPSKRAASCTTFAKMAPSWPVVTNTTFREVSGGVFPLTPILL